MQKAVYQVRERNRLEGHNDAVYSVGFSPDGKMIATTTLTEMVKIWSREGKLLHTLTAPHSWIRPVAEWQNFGA